MGNKGSTGKGRRRKGDEDSSDDEDHALKMAQAAWKQSKGQVRRGDTPEQAPARRQDLEKQAGPTFLDGKGKLWDPQGKRWVKVEKPQAAAAAAGLQQVSKTFPSGNRYEGTMLNNTYHGQGRLEYADGRRYDGEWFEGTMHGKGTFHYANGDVYFGQYFGGKQQGQGTFVWKNGDMYAGEWKAGKRHGQGKLTRQNGDGFNGTWTDGAPDMQILNNVHHKGK